MPEQLSPEAYEIRGAALVRELGLMDDDGNQEAYDRIARIAERIFGTEIVLITFMDSDRQWFKSHLGTEMTENRRDQTFCTHACRRRREHRSEISRQSVCAWRTANPLLRWRAVEHP